MKKFTLMSIILLVSAIFLLALQSNTRFSDTKLKPHYHPDKEFNDYWYNNEAEITHFHLKQARYGEIHEGDAVMIFVTEHLSSETYLKTYNENNNDIPTLKMNLNRDFVTGMYPYTIMTSVWTPVNLSSNPRTLRSTFSAVEWCGHMFAKCDLTEGGYDLTAHSYFPEEGDLAKRINGGMLEDEIWNRIRTDPDNLPTGELLILPSLQHIRLMHIDADLYKAHAQLTTENDLRRYSVEYKNTDRKLSIWFESKFPYRIVKWDEEYKSGYGDKGRILKTEAVATNYMNLEYWTKNTNADMGLRQELGLD